MTTYDQWKTAEPTPDPTDDDLAEPEPEEAEVCMGCSSDLDEDGDCTSRKCTWNRCLDCGRTGEATGHMTCQYPQDRW
jgi:hypothetical protein